MHFQFILFFVYGILFGGISRCLFYSIIFIIVYEYYVFNVSNFFPPLVSVVDRTLLNSIYIFGWILSRCLLLNETGLEEIVSYFIRE